MSPRPSDSCPFCSPSPAHVFVESDLVRGIWDAFPVSAGHALLVPRRHIATWFDATTDERRALIDAIEAARTAILQRHNPDGFNIGINVGAAAGQTVFHLHIHVIPRYAGDVPDPRGGVRHVIPEHGNYLLPEGPTRPDLGLVTGGDDPLLPYLVSQLAIADNADIVVSFALESGVDRVFEHLRDLLDRGGRLRLLTGDYLGITEPNALMRLLDLEGNVERRIFETGITFGPSPQVVRSFHPKAYIFERNDAGTAFVGSSNLSASALTTAVEWNYRVVSSRDGVGFDQTVAAFESLFTHPNAKLLDAPWIERYRQRRTIQRPIVEAAEVPLEAPKAPVEPNEIQRAALSALEDTRAAGNHAGLVVLATGLGKTWLSAFDTARPEFYRVLFVAHREEILNQALDTFRRIRPEARLGHYTGEIKDPNAEVVFASIQTLSRREHLERFSPGTFDYVVVDEFHHAAASSYRKLIAHFRPGSCLDLPQPRAERWRARSRCVSRIVYRCTISPRA